MLVFDLRTVLVEKILRVQPDVKKIFLLVRASDVESAKLRIQMEVKYFIIASFLHRIPCNSIRSELSWPLCS
jgi:hypothetical protein